jgi:hypothetical protein
MTSSGHAGHDDSFMFSLRELARMEEDRIAREAAAERARHEAALAAQRDAEQKAREAAEARARTLDEAARAAATREREEAARLEATRLAAMEGARVTAEAAARAADAELHRAHALELARLHETSGTKRLRAASWAIGVGGIVAIAAMTGSYALVLKPQADQRVSQAVAQRDARDEVVADRQAKLDALEQRTKALEEENASLSKDKRALARQVEDQRVQIDDLKKRPGTAGVHPPPAPTGTQKVPPGKPCPKGDPMCVD